MIFIRCLMDCFSRKVPGSLCFASLIADVTRKGTCDSGDNPASAFNETVNFWGWYDLENVCELAEVEDDYNYGEDDSYDYGDYSTPKTIVKGTCSARTERLLQKEGCMDFLGKQPKVVKNTLELLIQYSCRSEVYDSLPISSMTLNTKTELNFENTRHRYPWICSLRGRGNNPKHFCVVNILAVPPNPTVIVGSASCTYLCKDEDTDGQVLP